MLHDAPLFLADLKLSPDAAIANAQAWIDGAMEASGLAVPFVSPPAYISMAAANYACYLLVRRKNRGGEFDSQMEEFRSEAYRMRDDFRAGITDVPGDVATRENKPLPTIVNPHKKAT